MKTATLTTPTHEIMLVELPQNAREPKLFNDKDRPYISYLQDIETPRFYLPEGDWKDLGFVSNLKESEVEALVEKVMQGQHFQNYKARQSGVSEWSNALWCRTALKSFLSLLETKVMWENPIEYPKQGSYEALMTTNWEGLNKRWNDSQSRTFDKARTIVLVKER